MFFGSSGRLLEGLLLVARSLRLLLLLLLWLMLLVLLDVSLLNLHYLPGQRVEGGGA